MQIIVLSTLLLIFITYYYSLRKRIWIHRCSFQLWHESLREATFRQRPTCCAHSSAVRHLQAARSGSWDVEVHLASTNVRGKSTVSSKNKKERENRRDREKLPRRLGHAHTKQSCPFQTPIFLGAHTCFLASTHLRCCLLLGAQGKDPPCRQATNKKHLGGHQKGF